MLLNFVKHSIQNYILKCVAAVESFKNSQENTFEPALKIRVFTKN